MAKGRAAIKAQLELMQLREKIIQRLKEVIDPETLVDVISMGLIKNLHVTEDGDVSLEFRPSSSVCPLALPLALDIENALKTLSEIRDLSVTIRDHQMADELNRYLKEERE
jgi:metal-sulfur cluster biosynthetic enzyme